MTRIFKLKIIYICFLEKYCILLRISCLARTSSEKFRVFGSVDWSRSHRDLSTGNRPTRFTMESGLFRSGRSYWGKSDCREGKIRARWLLVMCREYRDTFCNRQVCFLVLVCNGDCVGRCIAETRNTRWYRLLFLSSIRITIVCII